MFSLNIFESSGLDQNGAVKVICSLTLQSQISEENHFLFLAQKSTSAHILTFMLNYGVRYAWKLEISFWHIDCWPGVQSFTTLSFNHSLIKLARRNIFFFFYPFIKFLLLRQPFSL